MKTLTLDLPTMYGDHHVVEVRRLLLELSGVEDVYASSGFRVAEITYDPAQIEEDTIVATLDDAGYLGDLLVPVETGKAVTDDNGGPKYFRHTMAHQGVGQTVSFAQKVSYSGRPLWPCPGVGPLNMMDDEGK